MKILYGQNMFRITREVAAYPMHQNLTVNIRNFLVKRVTAYETTESLSVVISSLSSGSTGDTTNMYTARATT
jgi:hypothetical protein